MFTKMIGIPTCLQFNSMMPFGCCCRLETDEIGARADNNFLDEYLDTFQIKTLLNNYLLSKLERRIFRATTVAAYIE